MLAGRLSDNQVGTQLPMKTKHVLPRINAPREGRHEKRPDMMESERALNAAFTENGNKSLMLKRRQRLAGRRSY
jgi:hypothetical protein